MIRYRPLWETMAKQKVTTYTLRVKHGMSHATVQRLQRDMPVSTHTLNKLCEILHCSLDAVAGMCRTWRNIAQPWCSACANITGAAFLVFQRKN